MRYLFYDIETTGRNPCFDQILQFAAIATDENLKEIERFEYQIQLNRDVIPSPGAILVNQIPIEQFQQGQKEYEAIREIHRLVNHPETISLGYNTLGFDDEFLRFSFYRNLRTPYTHQFMNNCGRMDLYPMTLLYYLYKPDTIIFGERDGKISFKLEDLNAANQFATGQAHTAIADVEATLGLARALFKEREMWDYLVASFNKKKDIERSEKFLALDIANKKFPMALLINGKLGKNNLFQSPVLGLGKSIPFSNQTLWLRLDNEKLSETTIDTVDKTTGIIRKKWGEAEILLPFPSRFGQKISPERLAIVEKNKVWLKENPALLNALSEYHCQYEYPEVLSVDTDAALYLQAFWNDEQTFWCQQFHKASIEKKISLCTKAPNERLEDQALRILGRNFFDELPSSLQTRYETYLSTVLSDEDTALPIDYRSQAHFSVKQALLEIEALEKTELSAEKKTLLADLKTFYLQLREKN